MRTAAVSFGRIRWGDRRFSFSSDVDPAPLAASIRREGLLVPPVLLEENGRYTVISGRRRLRALRHLGETGVTARIFSEAYITRREAWSLNFEETVTLRPLDAAEACRAVSQLTALDIDTAAIVSDYLPIIGLPPKLETCQNCLAVAALGEAFLGRLAVGTITFTTAAFLTSLAEGDRRTALRHLDRARLTVSQQREWVRLVGDVTRRDGLGIRPLLAAASRHGRKGTTWGGGALQFLREKRYPSLTKRKKAFAALLGRFALPPNVKIETHPFFERGELKVSFTSRDAAAYDRIMSLLAKIRRDPAFDALLAGVPPKKK